MVQPAFLPAAKDSPSPLRYVEHYNKVRLNSAVGNITPLGIAACAGAGASQSDSAIHGHEQRYRHLFENLPVCILVADLTVAPAVILEVNRRAELVYGYTADELVGNPAAHLVPEESRASVQNLFERVQRGETVTTEITNRRRDGTIFPARVIARLDPANSGHMIATVEDITAEKQRRSEAEAIDAERLRIAHEIHDGVAQSLGGLRFKVGAVVSSG